MVLPDPLPGRALRDVFTGRTIDAAETLRVRELLIDFPVALLG